MPPPIQAKAPPRRPPQKQLAAKTVNYTKAKLAHHALKALAVLLAALALVPSATAAALTDDKGMPLLIPGGAPRAATAAQVGGESWSSFIANSPALSFPCSNSDSVGIVRNNLTYRAGCSSFIGPVGPQGPQGATGPQGPPGSSCPALSPGTYTCSTVTINSSGCISIVSSGSCSGGGSGYVLVGGDTTSCTLAGGDTTTCVGD